MQPFVIANAMNFEAAAHAGESELRMVLFYERVLHPDYSAKQAAAFFRMSRSSVVRLSSALSLAISACIALMSTEATGSSAFLNFLTHV